TSCSTSRRGAVDAGGGTLVSGALLPVTGGRVSWVLFGGFGPQEREPTRSAVARSVITVRGGPVLFIVLLTRQRAPPHGHLARASKAQCSKDLAKPPSVGAHGSQVG